MTIKTLGSSVYFVDVTGDVQRLDKVTAINGLGDGSDEIDTDSTDEFDDDGQVSLSVVATTSTQQQALRALRASRSYASWMIALNDQVTVPTADADDRLVSPGPTTIEFLASIINLSWDFGMEDVIRCTITLERASALNWDV